MPVIVRRPEFADLGRYTELACEFIKASPIYGYIKLDPNEVADFLIRALDDPNIGLWLAEKDGQMIGVCGALVYPLYFSPSHKIGQELWWWLTPSARGTNAGKRMFEQIEAWTTEHKVNATFMIALADNRVEKMTKLYERAGYEPMERTFAKGSKTWQ